ncbi:MAG: tetratricopeptide repeat protein [Calditrichia bacterium]|nr:tetratricopeptide repeat protein [Calditrichia bacterium]
MLQTKRVLKILLIFVMTLAMSTQLFAQDEDLMDDEDMGVAAEDVKCQPDSLITPWDVKYANDESLKAQFGTNLSFGKDYYNKKNYDKASGYLWKSLFATSEARYQNWIVKKLIQCYYQRGIKLKGEQAVAYLDSALIMSYRGLEIKNDEHYHYWGASIQKLLQRYACAIPHYEKLVESQPENKGYWQTLAQMYARTKDEKAISAQQKVIDLDPNDQEARNFMEQLVKVLGGEIIEVYEGAYKSDPNNPDNCWKYGNALIEVGDFTKAIPVFKQYLKVKPGGVEAYAKIGEAYYGDLKFKSAISNYKTYLNKNPKDAQATVKLGDIYREQQSFQTAVSYAYKALRFKPGYGEAYLLIGKSYYESVSYCSGNREKPGIIYDDKLAYERAYNILAKALKDPDTSSRAQSLRRALKASLPTKGDKFLNENRTKIRDKCYSWIK